MDARARMPVAAPVPHPTPSYWHDDPGTLPPGSPPQAPLPAEADVVIVGGGITGLMVAWHLLENGGAGVGRVVLLEARGVAGGATGRNGGHTKSASYGSYLAHRSSLSPSEAIKIARLELANIRCMHAFASAHSLACESRPCNTVDIFYDQQEFDAAVRSIDCMRRDLGAGDDASRYAVYGAEEARSRFLVDGDVKGALEYEAGSISAYKFAAGVARLCVGRGLGLHTYTPVAALERAAEHPGVRRPARARWLVRTPRGDLGASTVVLATNGYSAFLDTKLQGLIVPLRGQITAQRPGSGLPRDGLPTTYSFIYANGYEYMIPRSLPPGDGAGRWDIVIGGGLGKLPDEGLLEYGETDDGALNEANSAYLRGCARRYFGRNWREDVHGLAKRVKTEWTGIMGITRDGLPFVGEMPGEEGCWICAGFNGHGMVLCFKSAEALAHLIAGRSLKDIPWFPESFLISDSRMESAAFEGRKRTKILKKSLL